MIREKNIKSVATVQEAEKFFLNIAASQSKNIKPLKTNKKKTAILVSRSDKSLYDWAMNG